jgi:hypothetical protein
LKRENKGRSVKTSPRVNKLILAAGLGWFMILGCSTTNLIARANPGATNTAAPTVRATFTRIPPTEPPPPPPPTAVPPPVIPPTRTPTPRRPPTRVPTPKPAAPTPVPPTPDLFGGFYYRPVNKGCSTSTSRNTRIEGTVYDNGVRKNGVTVRLSHGEHLDPLLPDFITGGDPSDPNHKAPEREGMYRLSPAEGGYQDGNWWVFVIDGNGNPLSKGQYIKTHDAPGCNIAIVDFVH